MLLLRTSAQVYGALTMRAQHQLMKIRGDSSAVSRGPDRDHALLAAFLDATSRIDRRALQKAIALSEAPKAVNLEAVNLEAVNLEAVDLEAINPEPVNLEAQPISFEADPVSLEAEPALPEASLTLLEVQPTSTAPKSQIAPFTFRRANLVKA
jgi:hypothetical protein